MTGFSNTPQRDSIPRYCAVIGLCYSGAEGRIVTNTGFTVNTFMTESGYINEQGANAPQCRCVAPNAISVPGFLMFGTDWTFQEDSFYRKIRQSEEMEDNLSNANKKKSKRFSRDVF